MPEEKSTQKTDTMDDTLKFLEDKGKKPEKKKPVHYKQKECPYCKKHVGNLGNHILLKHPSESPPQELTKDDLTGAKFNKRKDTEITPVIYYCNNCHAEVRKGEANCWNCQETLLWDGIE